MGTVYAPCSNQTHFMYVWDKRFIYLYKLVYVTKFVLKFNGVKFVLAVTYYGYHLAHIRLKGHSSQKSINFLLNPFCIKLVILHFSACDFAIVYLYKEISLNQLFHYWSRCISNKRESGIQQHGSNYSPPPPPPTHTHRTTAWP